MNIFEILGVVFVRENAKALFGINNVLPFLVRGFL